MISYSLYSMAAIARLPEGRRRLLLFQDLWIGKLCSFLRCEQTFIHDAWFVFFISFSILMLIFSLHSHPLSIFFSSSPVLCYFFSFIIVGMRSSRLNKGKNFLRFSLLLSHFSSPLSSLSQLKFPHTPTGS
jgi:hypothetical protein